jgi:retron-type reverse transcriptase
MLVARERGTPQGGVISPLLANLFLHYAFDIWLKRGFPGVPFERYADDIICHCRSEREALALRQVLERRFTQCGLVLHPKKTKVVYCKDTNRRGEHPILQFDFLGYTFRPRLAQWRGGLYGVSFLPAATWWKSKNLRRT